MAPFATDIDQGVALLPSGRTGRVDRRRPAGREPVPPVVDAGFPLRAGRVSVLVVLVASATLVGLTVGVLPRIAALSQARAATGDSPARLVDPFVGTAPQHPDV